MRALIASLFLVVITSGVGAAADPKPENPVDVVEGLFPGGISPYLARYHEPALGRSPQGDPGVFTSSTYRVTRLRPGALITLSISFAVKDLSPKPVEAPPRIVFKRGSFDKPDVDGIVLPASAADLESLFETFREEELFSLPSRSEERRDVMDGATWVFEQWDSGRYRVVARTSPRGGPVKACADAVLEFLNRFEKTP